MDKREERQIDLQQVLNDPKKQLNSIRTLEVINSCTKKIQEILPKIKGKKCVYIIGNTGAGKSTMINFLFGKSFRYLRNQLGTNQLICQDPICKIGYSRRSQTFLPQIFELDDKFVCDCPGFKDSRHPAIKLGNAINMHKSFKSSKEISFAIVVSFSEIQSNRGQGILELINTIGPIFGTDNSFLINNWDKIIVLVTGWQTSRKYPQFDDVLNYLTLQQPENDIFVKLKRQRKIFFVDPLNEQPNAITNAKLKQQLSRIGYIQSNSLRIGLPICNDDILLLKTLEQNAIAKLGEPKPNFQEFAKQIKKMQMLQSLQHTNIQSVTNNINEKLFQIIQKQKDKLLKLAQNQQLGKVQGSQNIRNLVSWIIEFKTRLDTMTLKKLNGEQIQEQFYKKKAQAIKLNIRQNLLKFSVEDQNYPTRLRQYVAKFKGKNILSDKKERQVLEFLQKEIEKLIRPLQSKCLEKGKTESLEENQGHKLLFIIEKLNQQLKILFPNFSVNKQLANDFLEKRKKIGKEFMQKASNTTKQVESQKIKINQLQNSLNDQKKKCNQLDSKIKSLQGQLKKQKKKNAELDLQKTLLKIQLQKKQQQDRKRFLKTFKKPKVIGVGSTWTNYTRQWTLQQWQNSGKRFEEITQLDLNGQNLQIIPKQLAMFPNLITLDLGYNQIQDLGDLSIIKTVQSLALHYNKITNIQPLQVLTKPYFIGLSTNNIENIQPLEKLTSLGSIYLNNNKIHTLANVHKLPNLTKLQIANNPLLQIQTEKNKIEQLKKREVKVMQ